MPSVSVPCPVCPWCEKPVSAYDFVTRIGSKLWHERCVENRKRTREWLSESEVEGGIG